MSPPQRLSGMATGMASGGADVTGTPLPTITDPSMPIAPSRMQRFTARAFGAGATEAGATGAGATGAGATEAGAGVGGAGSDQSSRLSPRSAILPAAKARRPTAEGVAMLFWQRGESG